MRSLVLGVLICIAAGYASAQTTIRQVDFKNFSYPLKDRLLGHAELKWLTTEGSFRPALRTIHLKNGKDLEKTLTPGPGGDYSGFEFESVAYADLTGGGEEDAIVDLRYLTGGTQHTNYVYFYALENGKPKLLAYCHTGDRAYFGLYKVYGEKQRLVIELFDPRKSEGDCCSAGFVRTRYRWDGIGFAAVGHPEYGALKEP
jgi:hypothetical protein